MLLSVKLKAKRIANPFCLCLSRRQLKAGRAGTKQIKSWSELTVKNASAGRNLLGDSKNNVASKRKISSSGSDCVSSINMQKLILNTSWVVANIPVQS